MIKNKRFKNLIGVKLSIDTPEDIDIAEKIIEFNGGENYVPFQILDQFFSISR